MADEMTKKEAFGYWWKIIFLAVFGLIAAGAAIYTVFWHPFSIMTLIYGLGMGAGAVFCGWAVKTITKEYFFWKNKGNKQE